MKNNNYENLLDKGFLDYNGLINLLRYRGLEIKNEEKAKEYLSFASYYDLVNGYKECFMDDQDSFAKGTSIEDLFEFYLLDRGVQNILFKYSAMIETYFKTALSYSIAKNISEDDFFYLNTKYYKNNKRIYPTLKNTFRCLTSVIQKDPEKLDNPTGYYLKNHNHVPPWILFKNVTFSTCINLYTCLQQNESKEVTNEMLRINVRDDYKVLFLRNSLNTIRRFRNAIAHNLKFISLRIDEKQSLSFKNILSEYEGTLLEKEDKNIRGTNDPYSMILAIVSILNSKELIANFFFDLSYQLKDFEKNETYKIYCKQTGIPEDILVRGQKYLEYLSKSE